MSVAMFVMYDIWVVFFLLLIEIISIAKLLIIVHFFVWKCEKQTLSYIHTKLEGDINTCFFCPTLKITWSWEVDAPEITWYE